MNSSVRIQMVLHEHFNNDKRYEKKSGKVFQLISY